jgi:HAE1 family hydrophobic/amphiphilic exporter-1
VRYTLTTINTGTAQGKIYASVYVRLTDREKRQRSLEDLVAEFRQRLSQVSGITITHAGQLDVVGGNKQIEFSLTGLDLKELDRLSRRLMEKLRTIPGLVDLDSSIKPDKPTLDVVVDRSAAAELGLNLGQLGGQLRRWVAGETEGNWRAPDDQTYDVIVRLPPASRNTESDIAALPIALPAAADGSSRVIRLDQVAKVVPGTGPNQINRRDLLREVGMNGNAQGRSAGEISNDIRKAMAEIDLPPGYAFQFSGSTKNMQESFAYALSALAMAVIFIYMILASQFKSFLQPLALMTSLPLTLIGVVAALLVFRSTLSIFSIIGVVMLMGLVTKNAILLVDFAIRARQGLVGDGTQAPHPMSREEALLLAARVRLRPILMTTLAMVFGMVPLAFALTEGSEQRAPMGQAVIGGVITSSLLTLVVVPVMYCYMDDLAHWVRRKAGFASVRQPGVGSDL